MHTSGSCWTGFWLGCGIAVFVTAAAMFGPHPLKMTEVEARLQTQVEKALSKQGFEDVVVEMDGQTAVLTGGVGSPAERQGAVDVAYTAAGPGGVYAGGVTNVADQIIVGTRASPFSWSAERNSAGLVIAGHVPGEVARQKLLETARARFGGAKVTDRMIVALGAPSAEWIDIANEALQQLGKLKNGKARLVDNRLSIVGEGEQASVADVSTRYDKPLDAPYQLVVKDLTIVGQPLGIPELGGLNMSEASAATCQQAFRQIMRTNVIEFETGSAAINAQSRGLLDNLAKVARRCDSFFIAVAGHTDDVGDKAVNLSLSRARAQTVKDYLVAQGVAAERLTAEGLGDAEPRVPNTNAANRARNRRIEFTVT